MQDLESWTPLAYPIPVPCVPQIANCNYKTQHQTHDSKEAIGL